MGVATTNYIGFASIPRKSFVAKFNASNNVIQLITTGYAAETTIAFYDGDTLITSGSLASGEATGIVDGIIAALENQNDNFTGFAENGQYKVVIDDVLQTVNYIEIYNEIANFTQEDIWALVSLGGETSAISIDPIEISVSQIKTTTKKKYDTKLLPEELLPKTAAKKTDVAAVKKVAETAQSTADAAQSTAETAQSTAETAQSTAETAQSTAETAQSTADAAQSTADAAQSTADAAISGDLVLAFEWDGDINGRDALTFTNFNFYKFSDITVPPQMCNGATTYGGETNARRDTFKGSAGTNCTMCGGQTAVMVYEAGECLYEGKAFNAPSRGMYFRRDSADYFLRKFEIYSVNSKNILNRLYLLSDDGAKQFMITVDDTGTISATEVTT